MAETAIEWTDAVWNPIAGCTILSAGCTNCYAMKQAWRCEKMGLTKYAGLTRLTGKRVVWTGEVREDQAELARPHAWRSPRRVFVNSMSDLFHEDVSPGFIAEVWRTMRATPHTYQILTKRPERMAVIVPDLGEPAPNVWLGTSIEDASVVHRLEPLRDTPAAVRFVSFEPLIGPVGAVDLGGIDWAIVGGESGPSARPIEAAWVDEIHTQCRAAGVAFFFKQWGSWGPDGKRRSKRANGRLYRERTWDEMPSTDSVILPLSRNGLA